MIKYILIWALVLPLCAYAQEETTSSQQTGTDSEPSFKNKHGQEVLPQQGDWSVGIGASTALTYVGNIFTGGTNNNADWWQYQSSTSPIVIQGKYMVSGTTAYKIGFNLNFYNNVSYYDVMDDNGSSPDDYVQDKLSRTNSSVTLLAGIEKRKGSGRIQGVYGADVFVNFSASTSYKYTYGNEITETNQAPSTGAPSFPVGGTTIPSQGYRPSQTKNSTNWGAGAYGFIGVEAFLFPKFSLGGKFTWGVSYSDSGASSNTYEAWDSQSNSVVEYTNASNSGYTINAGIGNVGGQVTANFYF
ncbi:MULTISPECIES: hypothetical protein [Reichenbachiella]|uniref:Protochlamydia outer membrane protein domain-containing protein n=1 Tax=Reichenbachiella agariperforans TaxID=156994 RepID=A0A1M6QIL0_REIAG|nr:MULTISPECIES: hypothetical protein [Reichenbachiella]MBU2914382.1 hypothetical protein [Reichenbachiella agariperforans]RJE73098.1 hypothetical protein BGP76_03920 [Reichenbachiella sp. MSK19-1]SHK19857.1 hypothetical protein SAMN04488028_103336 [Reichenbachiella agariperforans]